MNVNRIKNISALLLIFAMFLWGVMSVIAAGTPTIISVNSISNTYGNTVSLQATLTSGGSPLGSKQIKFYFNGNEVGSAITNVNGLAATTTQLKVNEGTYTTGFRASFTGDGTYAASSATAALTVAKRPITVTATTDMKIYDSTTASVGIPNITSGNLVADDTVTWSQVFENENVGTGKALVPSGVVDDGNNGNNYSVTFVNDTTGLITARSIALAADSQTKVYGDTDPVLTYGITSGALAGSDAFTGALSRVAGENTGNYAIEQGDLTLNSNYVLTFTGAELVITVRPISVMADPKTKTVGDADPELTYTITDGSLVGADNFIGALTRIVGEDVGIYAIEQGTLVLSANYSLTFTGNNLTISAIPDTTAPIITMNGVTPVEVVVGSIYTDAGATASDDIDGDITANIVIVNPVNTAAIGTYTITYDVSDVSGNPAIQVTRTVNVVSPPPVTYTITSSTSANGTITPSGDVVVDSGSDQSYVITPNDGYNIADVSVDGLSVGAVNGYTFNNITADHIIDASFAAIPSSAKSITSFSFTTPSATGVINGTDIEITVPYGTSVTALSPTIVISDNATVFPASGTAQNFADPIVYTVTAQDGTTQDYTVTVTVSPAPPEPSLTPTPTPTPTLTPNPTPTPNENSGSTGGVSFFVVPGPTGGNIKINDGALETNSNNITLNVFAVGARQMAISNSPDFVATSWEPYTNIKNWILSGAEGVKTVYTKFRNEQGSVSKIVSASIILNLSGTENITGLDGSVNGEILGAVSFNFNRNLGLGMRNNDVAELHKRLFEEGVYSGAMDDYFDNTTLVAVKKYQTKNGIPSTGFVGPMTRANLNKSIVSPTLIDGVILMRAKGDIRVYAIKNGYKRWILNPYLFDLENLKWKSVQEVDSSVLDSYQTVSLIRAEGDYKVYQVDNSGTKRWLNMTAREFINSGKQWTMIQTVSAESLSAYASGMEISAK